MKTYRRRFRKITLQFCPFTNQEDQKALLICNPCHHLEPNIIRAVWDCRTLPNKAKFLVTLSVYHYLPKTSSNITPPQNTPNSSMAQNSKKSNKKYFKKTSKKSFPKKSSRKSGILPFRLQILSGKSS